MQGNDMPAFEDFTLVVNSNNPIVKDIVTLSDTAGKKDLVQKLCHHVHDLAKMSKQQLTGEQLQTFITRSNELMSTLSKNSLG